MIINDDGSITYDMDEYEELRQSEALDQKINWNEYQSIDELVEANKLSFEEDEDE